MHIRCAGHTLESTPWGVYHAPIIAHKVRESSVLRAKVRRSAHDGLPTRVLLARRQPLCQAWLDRADRRWGYAAAGGAGYMHWMAQATCTTAHRL